MARYCIDLYFDKKLSREELLARITTMAGCQRVPDEPDTYCIEHVHISLCHLPQSKASDEIRQRSTSTPPPMKHLKKDGTECLTC